jgi:hypothetical protein
VTALGASAKMEPPSAESQAFDAACSARLGRWVDTIHLGLHLLLSGFRLPRIDRRAKSQHQSAVRSGSIAVVARSRRDVRSYLKSGWLAPAEHENSIQRNIRLLDYVMPFFCFAQHVSREARRRALYRFNAGRLQFRFDGRVRQNCADLGIQFLDNFS